MTGSGELRRADSSVTRVRAVSARGANRETDQSGGAVSVFLFLRLTRGKTADHFIIRTKSKGFAWPF